MEYMGFLLKMRGENVVKMRHIENEMIDANNKLRLYSLFFA